MEQIITINEDTLGPWSVSKLKMLQKCPLQFYLKYLEKFKPVEVRPVDEDNLVTFIGRDAHKILELALDGSHSVSEAMEHVRKTGDTPSEHFHNVESLEFNINSFMERMASFKSRYGIRKIYQELKLGVTKDFEGTSFFAKNVWFRGVIDLVLIMENNDIIIIDHKHGGDPTFGLKNYRFQGNTYMPMFHNAVTSVTGATFGVHFIKAGDILLGDYVPLEHIVEKIPNEIRFSVDSAISAVYDAGKFDYNIGSQCQYCEFRDMCRGGKRGTAGELQHFVEESKEHFK